MNKNIPNLPYIYIILGETLVYFFEILYKPYVSTHYYLKKENKIMEIERIKTGRITEQELVDLFGSDTQKKSYKENGRFVSKYKTLLFNKINKYCKIEECEKENGRRIYNITEIYKYPLPNSLPKMQKSLYKYICPLILNYLIDNEYNKNRMIDITVGKWSREINMVNRNYNLVKYNKEDTSKETQYPIELRYEFIEKTDDMLDYYITNALDYLKSAGLIIWREVNRINVEVSDTENVVIDENGKVSLPLHIESHQASKEEMEYYSTCINIADKEANINNYTERYYSKKSKHFNEVLKRELYKRKIKCVYKTYEAYYIDPEKCEYILHQFQQTNRKKLIKEFNNEFTEMILNNASKRFNKFPSKYLYCNGEDDYMLRQEGMCEMTIANETEYLGDRIKKSAIDDNYSLEIIK